MWKPFPDKPEKRRAFFASAGFGAFSAGIAVWGKLTGDPENFLLVGPFMLLPLAALLAGLPFGAGGAGRAAAFAGFTALMAQLACRIGTGAWNAEAMLITAAMAVAGAGTGQYFIRRAARKAKLRIPVRTEKKR